MLGQRWVAMQREIDRIVVPFGDAAIAAAAPQPGERVIDIGCGCGDTSIEIACRVGAAGAVLGVDVSAADARSRPVARCAHQSPPSRVSRRGCFRGRASGRPGFAVLAVRRDVLQPAVGGVRSFAQIVANGRPLRVRLLARAVRELDAEHSPIIVDAVEQVLVPFAAPDGRVILSGSTWIVSMSNPA